MIRILFIASWTALAITLSACNQTTQQTLTFDRQGVIKAGAQLLIQGENRAGSESVLVVRADDQAAPSYADRVNLERVIPPGRFDLRIPLGGLYTPGGRLLQIDKLQRLIVFQADENGGLHIEPLQIEAARPRPHDTFAWDLGPADSALWPGFTPMTADFEGIHGALLKAVDRGSRKQAAEGLTSDGIRGIETLKLPLPPGRWFITLWLRDPGEWEYLPHPLQRSIHADGNTVWSQNYSAMQWIEQVYLATGKQEIRESDDAWQLFGKRKHQRVSFSVNVETTGLTLTFTGDQPEAGFVSAIVAETNEHYTVRQQIENERATWWRNNWPVNEWPSASTKTTLQPLANPTHVAADTTVSLRFDLHQSTTDSTPHISLSEPQLNNMRLETTLYWGQWRLRRSGIASTMLTPDNSLLRSGVVASGNTLPRRLHLRIRIPKQAPAGLYKGVLSIQVGNQQFQQPLELNVLPIELPQADRPVGVYLERSVHFDWFDWRDDFSNKAFHCDLRFLRRQGLTGIAPPLTTPADPPSTKRFFDEVQAVANAGFHTPFLAYAPFKRLLATQGLEKTLSRIAKLEDGLIGIDSTTLSWAVADEPSNPGQSLSMEKIRRYADSYAPNAHLAGQLNHANDIKYLQTFDMALINAGFGVDEHNIITVKNKGAIPWLYNMNNKRAAAGFYLWRTGAAGYLQWHARMPGADPFDPTDAREDDVQFLYPMAEACPPQPDVDTALFELSDGINDLRWLLWLQEQAKNDAEAKAVLLTLRKDIPTRWQEMAMLSDSHMDQWRAKILRLAIR